MILFLAWFGAMALSIAPFFINSIAGKILACLGLAVLIPQAINNRAWNLVFLNLSGIVGYLWSIFNV